MSVLFKVLTTCGQNLLVRQKEKSFWQHLLQFFLGFVNRETMNDKPKRMIDIDNVDNRPKISHKIVNRNLV